MNQIKDTSTKVALPKLFLWNDPTRYQEYPEALSRAEEGRVYTRQEIEQELFDITPTLTYKKDGKPRGHGTDGIVNAMGFERFGQRLCVNGLDLIRKTDEGFVVSESGFELGEAYRDAANSDRWLYLLARNLLLREPRTRLFIGLMLKGWLLQVDVFNKFPKSQMSFVEPDNTRLNITSKDCQQFNSLLSEYTEMALGSLWITELSKHGLSLPIEWCGIRVDQPSVKDLSSAIKKSFGLLFYIGIFYEEDNGWFVDTEQVGRLLGGDVLESFGVSAVSDGQDKSIDDLFLEALQRTTDSEGYTIASALAEKFGELSHMSVEERDSALDRFTREAMYDDRLVIQSYHPGQPRMGRGLFGDSNCRRLKIKFTPSAKETATEIITNNNLTEE
ncbi:MAG: hypothetical protein APF84_12860 [Gracilibacter sp. BRH_c7a]|nr:MAG: hypothetical protein APF84_12860 [Gracilibacter sp. BRH_c7a]